MSISLPQIENRVVLTDVSWATFEALLTDTNHRGSRFIYDRGNLEIMSPSYEHERLRRLIGRLIETYTEILGIPIQSAGSTTLKSELKGRGLEPDECYYIANEPLVRGLDEIDLSVNPPPDLAVEIDISSSSLDQLSIYAALGVAEVWIYNGTQLNLYRLQQGNRYEQCTLSPALPALSPETVLEFLSRRNTTDETNLIKSFRQWVREKIKHT